jgi:DNA-binding response OmpR family regulator/uncharacterized coiled-coil DUF342 family protein
MLPPGMSVDPTQHRILLVGPRVVHLKPFFERRRYKVTAAQKGVEGMSALDAESRDIVILELNLGDLTATEFLMAARQAHADASFLLLDDASKAGQIVKALQAGLDGYLPTPPDEDRLFFEVERHLRRSPSPGLSDRTGETTVAPRPDATELQTQLADRESQLVEIGMQNELLAQETSRLRAEAKKLAEVRQALIGVIDGDLDRDQATRLKERLALATVLETEVDTLREELAGSRNVRRDQQEQIEQLKRRLEALGERTRPLGLDSLEGPALKDKANELEADNMVLAGRVAELEEQLDLARAEVVAAEQKAADERDELKMRLEQLLSERALKESDAESASVEHAASLSKLEDAHHAELTRLRDEHARQLARLREDHEAALARAVTDVEIEKAAMEARLLEASGSRELGEAAAAREAALRAAESELRAQLEAAIREKDEAVEKALDIELILDELKTKLDFLEGEARRAGERVQMAESSFKKEKLRLIEEKEQAAAGSQEAFQKVQRFIDENAALKRQNAELEAGRAALEEQARRGEAEQKQAAVIRAEAIQQRDTAESALKAVQAKLTALEERLGEEMATLRQTAELEKARADKAERALADAGNAANRVADANAARDTAEREAARLVEALDRAERALAEVKGGSEQAQKRAEAADSALEELRARATSLEEKLAARDAEARAAIERSTALEAQHAEAQRAMVEQYEARLREALAGGPGATADILAERDAYRNRLTETDAWVQQAQIHLEALGAERDQVAAQATALAQELQARTAEAQEFYAQLAQAKQQVEALAARAAGVEQELVLARQQLQRPAAGPDPQAWSQAQEEIRTLRAQLQSVQYQLQRGGGMPEEIEPLRWTLTAAIDALTALEGREPSLGAHLRNLRLLASTLQRLSPGA